MSLSTVRIFDSHRTSCLSGIKHDLRKAGGYYILPQKSRRQPDVEIRVTAIDIGDDDEDVAIDITGQRWEEVEALRSILARRFRAMNVHAQVACGPKHSPTSLAEDPAAWEFLRRMSRFEGVDVT